MELIAACGDEVRTGCDHLSCLDLFDLPVLSVAAGLQTTPLNRLAHELLARRDGLFLRHGQIAAARAQDHARLTHRLRRLLDSPTKPPPAGIAIQRDGSSWPLNLLLAAIDGPALGRWVAVFVGDPGRPCAPDPALLRSWFGLTPREAEITSRFAAGYGIENVADSMGIRVATVRTHLGHIFSKTGVTSQAQLVAMASTIPIGMTVHASAPPVPHPADAMWAEP